MSDKPFNTAKKTSRGTIEPVVHYFAPAPSKKQKNERKTMKRLKRANKCLLDKFSCKDPMSDFQSSSLRNTSQFDSKPTYRQILDAEQLLAIQRESLTEDSISPKSSSIIFEFSDPQSEKECPSTVLGRNTLLEVLIIIIVLI